MRTELVFYWISQEKRKRRDALTDLNAIVNVNVDDDDDDDDDDTMMMMMMVDDDD